MKDRAFVVAHIDPLVDVVAFGLSGKRMVQLSRALASGLSCEAVGDLGNRLFIEQIRSDAISVSIEIGTQLGQIGSR